jgi:hypothetical protein
MRVLVILMKRLLGRHMYRWEDNIKINFIYIYIFVCEDVHWIQLTITALPSAEVNILVQKPPVSFVFKQKLKAVDT